jgi:hypothetical protein
VISIIFIYTTRTFINEKYKNKLPFPIPFDLFLLIAGILISYFVDFNGRWSVKIVGDLPTG